MRRAIEAHLGSPQVARVIYGAIIGMALVVALEAHPPRPGVVAGTLLATAVAVGLAELYSEAVAAETRNRRRIARAELQELVGDVAPAAFGIAFPAIFFVLAAIGLWDTDSAFSIAKWSGLGLISMYGFLAGRLAGATVAVSLVEALAVGLIGGILIAFKALVH